jgi:hypothetical protein
MKDREPQSIKSDEARLIAQEAFIYGYPMVDNYRIQYSYFVNKNDPEYKASWNTIYNNTRLYTPDDKAIQTPNSDTPYSYVGTDLRAEPLVTSVPAIENNRYYSLQFIDAYTHNFAYIGSRTTGNGAGTFLLAGPRWNNEKPEGIKDVIRSETEFVFLLIRTQLFDPSDIENVKKVQAGYKVQTLSSFFGSRSPPPAPAIDFPKPPGAEEQRTSLEFFNILNFILQFCPTHPTEIELMKRFAKIGIGAGVTFNVDSLSPEIRKAIQDGMADGWKACEKAEQRKNRGEFSSTEIFGTRDFLKNNYLYRMVGAVGGIYGNSKEEAVYGGYFYDSTGKPLSGAQMYSLHFDSDRLPPANAFWSLTMYALPARLLIANPLNRYLINSSMLPNLKKDANDGFTIYISAESPGKDKESNWLPAPSGPFFIAFRMYSPKKEAIEGTWKQPPLERQS